MQAEIDKESSKAGFVQQGGLVVPVSHEYIETVSQLTPEKVEKLKSVKSSVLGIRCRRSDCKNSNLHCFDTTVSKPRYALGCCQDCGADLIDWTVFQSRSTDNFKEKFEYLNKEWIRHFFFNLPIPDRVETHAQEKGRLGLVELLESRFHRKSMQVFDRDWDRRQTPMLKGTITDWARHATGSCCRRCLSYWHGVSVQDKLKDSDIEYLTALAMSYVTLRVPSLST
jgi:hypothetical protein